VVDHSIKAEQERTGRYLFATMHKLWPLEPKAETDERRACLAIMITKDDGRSSWKELSTAELLAIGNQLKAIEQGLLTMEPTVGGYVFTLKTTAKGVRKLYITRTENGAWRHWTQEREQ